MTHFIDDNTGLGDAKSNFIERPEIPIAKKVRDIDWNNIRQALLDIQSWWRGGAEWYGYTEQATDPAPSGVSRYTWAKTDGRLHYKGSTGDKAIATLEDVAGSAGLVVDLTSAPYNIVAGDSSVATAAANTAGVKAAIAAFNGLRATLRLPRGDIYFDQDGTDNWSILFGTGVSLLALIGHGRYSTRLLQQGTSDGGDWDLIKVEGASSIYLGGFTVEQGIIGRPDPVQQNHLIHVANTIAAGITKNILVRDVRFGKCIGDAFRVLSDASPRYVENVVLDDFEMELNGTVLANWAQNTPYLVGHRVINDSGKNYVCVDAGTSASAGAGPTGTGAFTFADKTIVTVDPALDQVTVLLHTLQTGDGPVNLATSGTLPGGLDSVTDYYIIAVDANTISFATSAINAFAGTIVPISDAGSGTHTIADVIGENDGVSTRRAVADNSAFWVYFEPRIGARSGIALQRGFLNVAFRNGTIIGAQNSLIDFEPTAPATMDGVVFENIYGDNSLGNTGAAMSFSGVSGGDNVKNLKVINVTCVAGRVNISGQQNALFERLTCIINATLQADAASANVFVRQDCTDLVFKDLHIERNGGTAGSLLDIENSGDRTTIDGGLFIQNTARWPIIIDGSPGGLFIRHPTIRYTGASASSFDAIVVQAVTGNVDICHIEDVNVYTTTGALRSAVTLAVRTPRTLGSIRITNIEAPNEVTYGVYFNIGTTGTPVWDRHPFLSGINVGSAIPWYSTDQNDNHYPDVVHPRSTMWVNDFGAVGDWNPTASTGTDNRTAFVNAFDWLANSGRGAELVIPPGNYRLSKYAPLVGARGAKIRASAFATIYYASDDVTTVYDSVATTYNQARSAFYLKKCRDVTIEGVGFVGGDVPEVSNINLGVGVYASRCRGLRVINCRGRAGNALFVQDSLADTQATSGSTLTVSSGIVTLTNDGDANYAFHAAMIGQEVQLTNATNAVNNGRFTILTVPSSTQLTFANAAAIAESPSSPVRFVIADGDSDTRIVNCTSYAQRGVSHPGSNAIYDNCTFERPGIPDKSGIPDRFSISGTTVTLTDGSGDIDPINLVGRFVQVFGATTSTNNGTFLITAATKPTQSASGTIVYTNALGVSEAAPADTCYWFVSGGDKVGRNTVGTSAILSASGVVTFTADSAIFAASDVGKVLRPISPTSSGNRGSFVITRFISDTQVQYVNTSAVSEDFVGVFSVDGFDARKSDNTVGPAISSSSTSTGVNSLTDTGQSMVVNAYAGRYLTANGGVQWLILSNTATVFTLGGTGTPASGAYTVPAGSSYGSTHATYLFAGRSNVSFSQCTFKNVRTNGVKISGSQSPIDNVEIVGCTFINCGAAVIAGADDAQEHANINIHHNKLIDCGNGRVGWSDQWGIGVLGARNVNISDNNIHATRDAVAALIDSGTLGGYYGIFAGRYLAGRSQPLEDVRVNDNELTTDPNATRPNRVAASGIHIERVGQRSKWHDAATSAVTIATVSGNVRSLTDGAAFFHQSDVGATFELVNFNDAGNNGVFTVLSVTGITSLTYENATAVTGSQSVGTYRLKHKSVNPARRGGMCSVSNNQISGYGAAGIDSLACVAPEIRNNTFNGMGTAISEDGSVGPRFVGNREITAGSNSARIIITKTTSWPFFDDNVITNGSLAGGSTSIDGVLAGTRSDMGIGVITGTAIDYPLCGKHGRTKSTAARAELVQAFGSDLVDGDSVDINGTVYTYKSASPTGNQFNTYDDDAGSNQGLLSLVGSGFTAEDYGTGLTGTPATGHMRVRLSAPARTLDHGFVWRVNTLNPTALVALFNETASNEAISYTRGEGVAMTGAAWTSSAATFTADNTTEELTVTGHGLVTGDGIGRLTNSGGALPAGLATATDYWIIKVDADKFKLATSRANAFAGTAVTLTDDGTGTHTITMSLVRRLTVWSPACRRTAGVMLMPDNQVASLMMSGGWYRESEAADAGACEVMRTNTSMGSDEEFRWLIP